VSFRVRNLMSSRALQHLLKSSRSLYQLVTYNVRVPHSPIQMTTQLCLGSRARAFPSAHRSPSVELACNSRSFQSHRVACAHRPCAQSKRAAWARVRLAPQLFDVRNYLQQGALGRYRYHCRMAHGIPHGQKVHVWNRLGKVASPSHCSEHHE
jgi:hypothetical protein